MATDKYRELRRKYGTGSVIMLSVDFIELSLILSVLKLIDEKPALVQNIAVGYEKYATRLRNRIIAAIGQLGLSVDEIEVLKTKFT
jgi:hypothetical protein